MDDMNDSEGFLLRRNLALNIDDEWLVLSCSGLSPDDLVTVDRMLRLVIP